MYIVGKTLFDRSIQQGVGAQSTKLKVICVKTLNFRQLS